MDTSFDYSYEVGSLYGRAYQIGVRADPDLNDIHSFAAVLFYETGSGERTEIARIDDSEHENAAQAVHIDRLYREPAARTKEYDIDVSEPFEADAYLSRRWERFAQQYETNYNE